MPTETKIQEWADTVGVDRDTVKLDGGNPVVWVACNRCGGTGKHWAHHVERGICFGCGGGKGTYRGLQGMAASRRATAKRNAKRATEYREGPRRNAAAARAILAANAGLAVALRTNTNITRSFSRQLARKGTLSEKQIATAYKVATDQVQRAADKIAEAAAECDVPEGRHTVTGVIVSLKDQPGYAYNTTDYKMLVKCDGYRLFGSVPTSILRNLDIGDTVTFAAALEPKEKGFGFYKRPTKAEVTARADENSPGYFSREGETARATRAGGY
jgi:hypothetical protein